MDTHIIYIGLGSNLGDGRQNLDAAVKLLQSEVGEVLYTSGYIESEPWGFESQHTFTNAVTVLSTELDPIALLDVTQRIERRMGRTHKRRPGEQYRDRIIDIDILLYDDISIQSERLVLPHPHIAERDFVSIPLRECQQAVGAMMQAAKDQNRE